jgi:hypothetical protein
MESNTLQYAQVDKVRVHGSPRPRLDAYGYTVRAGSPTTLQVRLQGEARWRRVYCLQFSNAGSFFLHHKGGRLFVRDSDIPPYSELLA